MTRRAHAWWSIAVAALASVGATSTSAAARAAGVATNVLSISGQVRGTLVVRSLCAPSTTKTNVGVDLEADGKVVGTSNTRFALSIVVAKPGTYALPSRVASVLLRTIPQSTPLTWWSTGRGSVTIGKGATTGSISATLGPVAGRPVGVSQVVLTGSWACS